LQKKPAIIIARHLNCFQASFAKGRQNTDELKQLPLELEEASTHKSAKTHAGNVFVTSDLDL